MARKLKKKKHMYIALDPEYWTMLQSAIPNLTEMRVYESPPVMESIGDYLRWANGEV